MTVHWQSTKSTGRRAGQGHAIGLLAVFSGIVPPDIVPEVAFPIPHLDTCYGHWVVIFGRCYGRGAEACEVRARPRAAEYSQCANFGPTAVDSPGVQIASVMRFRWIWRWCLVAVVVVTVESFADDGAVERDRSRLDQLTIDELVDLLDNATRSEPLMPAWEWPEMAALQRKMANLPATEAVDSLVYLYSRVRHGIEDIVRQTAVAVLDQSPTVDTNRLLSLATIVWDRLGRDHQTWPLVQHVASTMIPVVATLNVAQINQLLSLIAGGGPMLSQQLMEVMLSDLSSFTNKTSCLIDILSHLFYSVDIGDTYPLLDVAAPILSASVSSLTAKDVVRTANLYAEATARGPAPSSFSGAYIGAWAFITTIFPDAARQVVAPQPISGNLSNLFDAILRRALSTRNVFSVDDIATLSKWFRRAGLESAAALLRDRVAPCNHATIDELVDMLLSESALDSVLPARERPEMIALQRRMANLSTTEAIDHLVWITKSLVSGGTEDIVRQTAVAALHPSANVDADRLIKLATVIAENPGSDIYTIMSLWQSLVASTLIPAVPMLTELQLQRLYRLIQRVSPSLSHQIMEVVLSDMSPFANKTNCLIDTLALVVENVDPAAVYPLFDAAAPILTRDSESLTEQKVAQTAYLYARAGVGPSVPPGTPATTDEYWADLSAIFPNLPRQIASGRQQMTNNTAGLFDAILHRALSASFGFRIVDIARLLISFRRARLDSASALLRDRFAPTVRSSLPSDVTTLCMLIISFRDEPDTLDVERDCHNDIRRVAFQRLVMSHTLPSIAEHPLILSAVEFAFSPRLPTIVPEVTGFRSSDIEYRSCQGTARVIALFVRHRHAAPFDFVQDVVIRMLTSSLWSDVHLFELVDALVILAESGADSTMLYDAFTVVLFRHIDDIDPVSTSRVLWAFALADLPRYAIGFLPRLTNVTLDALSPHMMTGLNSWRMSMPDDEYAGIIKGCPDAVADLFDRCLDWVRDQPLENDLGRRCPRTGHVIDSVGDDGATAIVIYKSRPIDIVARLRHRSLARHGWTVKGFVGSQASKCLAITDNMDALQIATRRGDVAQVTSLLRRRPSIVSYEKPRWTPMHTLAQSGRGDITSLIDALSSYFRLCAGTLDGQTPFDVAQVSNNEHVTQALGHKRASCRGRAPRFHVRPDVQPFTGIPVLSLYTGGSSSEEPLIVFARSNAPVTSRMESVLHVVVRYEADLGTIGGTVDQLVADGVSVTLHDADGRTVLHEVARRGYSDDLVELLLGHGAAINAEDYQGQTPLHLAADNGRAEIVRCLLDQGADIDAADRQGRTALHLAAESGRNEAIDVLIRRGANDTAVDSRGRRPIDVALDPDTRATLSNAIRDRRSLPRRVDDVAVTPDDEEARSQQRDDDPSPPLPSIVDTGRPPEPVQSADTGALFASANATDAKLSRIVQWSNWAQYVAIGGSLRVLAASAKARYRPSRPTSSTPRRQDAVLTSASLVAGLAVGVAASRIRLHLLSSTGPGLAQQHSPDQRPRTTPVPWGAIVVGTVVLLIICIFIYRLQADDITCPDMCCLGQICIAWYRFRVMIGRPPRSRACRTLPNAQQ